MSSTSVKFIPQGAIIQEFLVGPDSRNIVLSFNTAAEYRSNPAHFGATIGRVANRLKNAKLDCLNGTVYPLAVNDPPNSLHGGIKGWGAVDWTGPTVENRVSGRETVVYKYRSVHMEEGFPGTVDVSVAYTAYEEATEEAGVTKTVLEMEYEANLVGEDVEETAINITNHSYFNLGGGDTITGTRAILSTADHLAVDPTGIPISTAITPYPGITANTPFTLGPATPEVDDCFVLDTTPASITPDTRLSPLKTCARFFHPTTKIHLDVFSTDPAFQFYTGKYLDVAARPDGSPARGPRSGFCVEPSRYVNAANVDAWKGMTVIRKGKAYGSKIVFKAWQSETDGF
ncbi:hypothetical protein Q9L58_001862 [Maublancomyces gigas]|uniref:Aldose 1-epimerase n=1 Tax=Discina gigas TaxID=1032678 RepID=A0ABR3GUB2_9PEZI